MEKSDAERMRDLEERINRLRAKDEPKHHSEEHYSMANIAWRMVIEMVAGIGIGFLIGLGLDVVLGTKPFLMVVFFFLGLAAGVRTMMRTAREVQIIGPDAAPLEGDIRGDDSN